MIRVTALCPKCFGVGAVCLDQLGREVPAPSTGGTSNSSAGLPPGQKNCTRCQGVGVIPTSDYVEAHNG